MTHIFKFLTTPRNQSIQLKRLFTAGLGLLTIVGLTLTPPLAAMPVDETITVTASRLPIVATRAGNALEIITREDIEAINPASLPDLLRSRSGLSVSQQSGIGGLTQVRMRGREANHVLVLIDGIEANDVGQGSEFNFSQFPIHLIERIEIVHGAESALWGSDAVAGVIHIMTRAPIATPNTDLAVETGTENTHTATLKTSGRLGETAYSIGLSHFETDGINVSRRGDERDGSKQQALFINAERSISEQWSVAAQASVQDSLNAFDDVDYVASGLPIDAPFESAHTRVQTGLHLSREQGNREQRLKLSFSRDTNDNFTYPGADTQTDGRKQEVSYQLSWDLDQHLWTGYAELEQTRFKQSGPASPFGDPNQDRRVKQQTLGGEYRFQANQWTHGFSLRLDRNSDFDHAVSLKGSTVYWMTDETRLFASLGQSVKNPTFTERFGYFTNFLGNPDLEPESSLALDLGLHHRWPKYRLNATLQLFSALLENEINGFSFDTETFAYTAVNLRDKSRQRGAELQFSWLPSEALSIELGLNHLDATSGDGTREIRRPSTTGRLALAYTQGQWQWRLTGAYTGSSLDTFYPPQPPYVETLKLNAFSLWSLSGNWSVSPQVNAFVAIDNLTDKAYEEVIGYQRIGLSARFGIKFRLN